MPPVVAPPAMVQTPCSPTPRPRLARPSPTRIYIHIYMYMMYIYTVLPHEEHARLVGREQEGTDTLGRRRVRGHLDGVKRNASRRARRHWPVSRPPPLRPLRHEARVLRQVRTRRVHDALARQETGRGAGKHQQASLASPPSLDSSVLEPATSGGLQHVAAASRRPPSP